MQPIYDTKGTIVGWVRPRHEIQIDAASVKILCEIWERGTPHETGGFRDGMVLRVKLDPGNGRVVFEVLEEGKL